MNDAIWFVKIEMFFLRVSKFHNTFCVFRFSDRGDKLQSHNHMSGYSRNQVAMNQKLIPSVLEVRLRQSRRSPSKTQRMFQQEFRIVRCLLWSLHFQPSQSNIYCYPKSHTMCQNFRNLFSAYTHSCSNRLAAIPVNCFDSPRSLICSVSIILKFISFAPLIIM